MAKRPTIRLKKTELPIDSSTAQTQADLNQLKISDRATILLDEAHKNETGRWLDTAARFRVDFSAASFVHRAKQPMKIHPNFQVQMSRRLLDCESSQAPWIWKAKQSLSGATYFTAGKIAAETFRGHDEFEPFSFHLSFDGKIFDYPVLIEDRGAATAEFTNSKQMRALKRYITLINWGCIKASIPAFFRVRLASPPGHDWMENCWDDDRIFSPGARIDVEFVRAWLSDPKYTAISLVTGSTSSIPAEYDLEEARKRLFTVENGGLTLRPLPGEAAFQLVTSTGRRVAPTAAWTEALLFSKEGNSDDIQSGKAPIPPKAEVVLLTTLLEKIPEMKRIIRTLMRIAKPYDHASFLPADF